MRFLRNLVGVPLVWLGTLLVWLGASISRPIDPGDDHA